MECLTKNGNSFQPLTTFSKYSILDVWQGYEYASALLKLFRRGSERDTRESWYMPNWLDYSLQIKNFPLLLGHTWKYFIHEMISYKFDALVRSLIFFVPMSQTISVKNNSGGCYFLHASN